MNLKNWKILSAHEKQNEIQELLKSSYWPYLSQPLKQNIIQNVSGAGDDLNQSHMMPGENGRSSNDSICYPARVNTFSATREPR